MTDMPATTFRIGVAPAAPATIGNDTSSYDGDIVGAPIPSPEQMEALQKQTRLDSFLDELTRVGGQPDGGRLRLLYQQVAPEHQPVAMQALEPFRHQRREALLDLVAANATANVDELRRNVARLFEIGTEHDAVADPGPSATQSAASYGDFRMLLQVASSSPGVEDKLRSLLVSMTPNDRSQAASVLASFRRDEVTRIEELRRSTNGDVDPSEYAALQRLAQVDAPVREAELPSDWWQSVGSPAR